MLGTLDNSQCASNGFSSAGSKKDRTNLHRVCEENALKVVASPLNQHLEADEQIVFETQAGEMQCWETLHVPGCFACGSEAAIAGNIVGTIFRVSMAAAPVSFANRACLFSDTS